MIHNSIHQFESHLFAENILEKSFFFLNNKHSLQHNYQLIPWYLNGSYTSKLKFCTKCSIVALFVSRSNQLLPRWLNVSWLSAG